MVLRVREVRRGVWWMYGLIREWAAWMAAGVGSILIVVIAIELVYSWGRKKGNDKTGE